MTKAYSYIRFSTPEQIKGDSLRRQTEATEKYCQDHGLTLDTSLNMSDLGLSAFHGVHRKKGALGIFLDKVKAGEIETGSYLLVESLDRLSREDILDADEQFKSLIRAGIRIVSLKDNQEYSRESITKDWTKLMRSTIEQQVAN